MDAQAGAGRLGHALVADFNECVCVLHSHAFGVLYKHTNNSLRMTEDLNRGRDVKPHFLQVRVLGLSVLELLEEHGDGDSRVPPRLAKPEPLRLGWRALHLKKMAGAIPLHILI